MINYGRLSVIHSFGSSSLIWPLTLFLLTNFYPRRSLFLLLICSAACLLIHSFCSLRIETFFHLYENRSFVVILSSLSCFLSFLCFASLVLFRLFLYVFCVCVYVGVVIFRFPLSVQITLESFEKASEWDREKSARMNGVEYWIPLGNKWKWMNCGKVAFQGNCSLHRIVNDAWLQRYKHSIEEKSMWKKIVSLCVSFLFAVQLSLV